MTTSLNGRIQSIFCSAPSVDPREGKNPIPILFAMVATYQYRKILSAFFLDKRNKLISRKFADDLSGCSALTHLRYYIGDNSVILKLFSKDSTPIYRAYVKGEPL